MCLESLTVRGRVAALAVVLVAGAACRDGARRPVEPAAPLTLRASPDTVACIVGQSVTVTLAVGGATHAPQLAVAAQNANVVVAGTPPAVTVSCVQPGASSVHITATSDGRSAAAMVPVTVARATPLTVSLQPAEVACTVGQTAVVAATVGGAEPGRAPTVTFTPTDDRTTVAAIAPTAAGA